MLGEVDEEKLDEALSGIIAGIRSEAPKLINQFSTQNAVFKSEVGDGGRVTIPSAERNALGIEEDDIVQVVVHPIKSEE
ncbi:hypothetical protein AKJ66_02595 [candidate division MSBL1 archaeon SCGC-AAA259E22]|uniref:SpoVT-AbrB domain-containing protein n=1 Tax=candidate division MSBL1 archaeon SCGC-AAA259E22 TaxID=1698265 RepID=A0A133UG48_9EURY|nr:hypothetical protein AKJ66_02595 [candidate division MSBL1 archaeon SCGC-AAA259E22]